MAKKKRSSKASGWSLPRQTSLREAFSVPYNPQTMGSGSVSAPEAEYGYMPYVQRAADAAERFAAKAMPASTARKIRNAIVPRSGEGPALGMGLSDLTVRPASTIGAYLGSKAFDGKGPSGFEAGVEAAGLLPAERFAVLGGKGLAAVAPKLAAMLPGIKLGAKAAEEAPLLLPAPGPGLPKFAAKPRGGQWWLDREYAGLNSSPEEAARAGARSLGVKTLRWTPEGEAGDLSAFMQDIQSKSPEQQWLEKALAKYYKTEFGSPEDPLRDLAERGLHYDPDMTPERWKSTVDDFLMEDNIGDVVLPQSLWDRESGAFPGAGDSFTSDVRMSMPWLAKQPVTDKIYGIGRGGLDLEHFTDEFYNALNAESAGLPAELAVRPEMLERMSFPQAVERVGRINQFRAKEMERKALSNLDSPAVHTFKEYAENNPMGLRWVELKAPEPGEHLLDELDRLMLGEYETAPGALEQRYRQIQEEHLQDALRYEGDTMGHCVGGYCEDVLGGKSRIFSLRDAKGEPHVTVETAPGWRQVPGYTFSDVRAAVGEEQANAWLDEGLSLRDMVEGAGLPARDLTAPDDIIQIKGKQNRAPKDDYLPFVQDFVKSGQWGNVGDLGNAGLVKLPDGRYITQQQYQDIVNVEGLHDAYQSYDFNANGFPSDPSRMAPEDWEEFSRYFEGYAIGGRVSSDRCFTRNPLSVPSKKSYKGGLAVKKGKRK